LQPVNLRLTEEQQALRETFAALFTKECSPDVVRAAEPLGHDVSLWARLSDIGLLQIGVPESLGGAGAGLFELVLVAEEAGRRLAPVPLAETITAARLLGACGAKELLQLVLEGALMVSLPPAPGPVRTQVLADGAVADVVLGLFDGRLVAVSRPTNVRAISNRGSLPLARWSDAIDGVVLAEAPGAARYFSAALAEVRLLRAAALIGLAAEAIEIGADYARERSAFGIPIGSYQAVAHPLTDALVAKDGAQLLVWKASWALDTDHPDADVLARQAFIFAAELAGHAAQHSLHIHGGYGFTQECDIQLYYRRSQAWASAVADPGRELLALGDRILPRGATEPGGGARGL
jgi:alkylation response protein AidB-like acyl-CoA dehydrogenase